MQFGLIVNASIVMITYTKRMLCTEIHFVFQVGIAIKCASHLLSHRRESLGTNCSRGLVTNNREMDYQSRI